MDTTSIRRVLQFLDEKELDHKENDDLRIQYDQTEAAGGDNGGDHSTPTPLHIRYCLLAQRAILSPQQSHPQRHAEFGNEQK